VVLLPQVQHGDHDDELNSKLTDYLQKLEDMTHQLGELNSRMQECEDSKVGVVICGCGHWWWVLPAVGASGTLWWYSTV